MKRIALLALASGMAIAAASPANAALVIGYSVNGGTVTQLANDTATPGSVSFAGTAGGYSFNTGALGTPNTASVFDLLTQSINIQSSSNAASVLNVFITETNLPTINGSLMSAFTSNILTNATARISSFYSPSNALYGGTLLQTANFTNIGTFVGSNSGTQAGPFSLTTRYDISFGAGSGTFNGTANLTAVPEPATWGMMIVGFGLMGGALRRRKTTVAFA